MKNYKKVNYDVFAAVKSAFNAEFVGFVNVRREGRNVMVLTQANDTTDNVYVYECTPEGRVSFIGYYEAFGDGTLWPATYEAAKDRYIL